jgi:hypothetical protein
MQLIANGGNILVFTLSVIKITGNSLLTFGEYTVLTTETLP